MGLKNNSKVIVWWLPFEVEVPNVVDITSHIQFMGELLEFGEGEKICKNFGMVSRLENLSHIICHITLPNQINFSK